MPSIVTREYNPTNGTFIGNVSSLGFGRIPAGSHSSRKVIDLSFIGVDSVSNIRVGLASSGGLVVIDGAPSGVANDHTASNGYFGIMHTPNFDPTVSTANLTRHFAGDNVAVDPDSQFNVWVGTKAATTSQFIYLDVELGDDLGSKSGTYKIFFDYVPL